MALATDPNNPDALILPTTLVHTGRSDSTTSGAFGSILSTFGAIAGNVASTVANAEAQNLAQSLADKRNIKYQRQLNDLAAQNASLGPVDTTAAASYASGGFFRSIFGGGGRGPNWGLIAVLGGVLVILLFIRRRK